MSEFTSKFIKKMNEKMKDPKFRNKFLKDAYKAEADNDKDWI